MCWINDYIISNAIKTVQEIKKKLKFKINKINPWINFVRWFNEIESCGFRL